MYNFDESGVCAIKVDGKCQFVVGANIVGHK